MTRHTKDIVFDEDFTQVTLVSVEALKRCVELTLTISYFVNGWGYPNDGDIGVWVGRIVGGEASLFGKWVASLTTWKFGYGHYK